MDFLTSLNFWLWAAAGLLAVAYAMAGGMKATQPIDKLAVQMKWPSDYPRLTRFIGVSEVLGAVGLILPLLTGIFVWLTPLAAICLVAVQILAIGFHVMRKEPQVLPVNFVLLALAAFVAWGRWSLFGM
ncbi:MAG: DoxX family protein [Devosia sp.]